MLSCVIVFNARCNDSWWAFRAKKNLTKQKEFWENNVNMMESHSLQFWAGHDAALAHNQTHSQRLFSSAAYFWSLPYSFFPSSCPFPSYLLSWECSILPWHLSPGLQQQNSPARSYSGLEFFVRHKRLSSSTELLWMLFENELQLNMVSLNTLEICIAKTEDVLFNTSRDQSPETVKNITFFLVFDN